MRRRLAEDEDSWDIIGKGKRQKKRRWLRAQVGAEMDGNPLRKSSKIGSRVRFRFRFRFRLGGFCCFWNHLEYFCEVALRTRASNDFFFPSSVVQVRSKEELRKCVYVQSRQSHEGYKLQAQYIESHVSVAVSSCCFRSRSAR